MVTIAQGTDRHAVLNLSAFDFVSSAGLRIIVRVAKLLQVRHGQLTICGVSGKVSSVLQTARFHSLLKIFDTEREAVASFSA